MDRYLTCKEILDFLDNYLSGNQAADVRAEFDRHLAVCPMCRDYLQTYSATVRLADASRQAVTQDAPEDLIQAILAARKC